MDKNTSGRFAEPTIIGSESEARQYVNRTGAAQSAPKSESRANKFDAEKFLRQGAEKSKAEAERRKKRRQSSRNILYLGTTIARPLRFPG